MENEKLKILSITGCAAGIAHTFMAAEGIEIAAKKLGHQIKVETHGVSGPENVFTAKEIEEADLILIAADINVPVERFYGKKIYLTNTDLAMTKGEKLIEIAIENSKILVDPKNKKGESSTTAKSEGLLDIKTKNSVIKHIMFALSWMIPLIIGGGLSLALGIVIALDPGWIQGENGAWEWGKVINLDVHPLANNFYFVGITVFALIIPVMAAAVAYSISGKLGFAPAFIGGYIMNDGEFLNLYLTNEDGSQSPIGTGFLGAIAIGFFVGYLINLYKRIPINKKAKPIVDLILVPFLVTIIVIFASVYVFGPILGPVVKGMFLGLTALESMNSPIGLYLIAAIIGMMMCFDLGGPVNKTAYLFATWAWFASIQTATTAGDFDFVPYTAMHAAQGTPALGVFFSSVLFGKKFTKEERSIGYSCSILGGIGLSEGAIPFAAARPKAYIPANLVGGAAVGIMTVAFGFHWYAGLASPFDGFIGYVPSTYVNSYFLSGILFGLVILASGVIVSVVAVSIMTISEKNVRYVVYKNEQKEEIKIAISKIKEKTNQNIINFEKEMNKNNTSEEQKNNILFKIELIQKSRKKEISDLKKAYKDDLKIQKAKFIEIFKAAKITKKQNIIEWKEKNISNIEDLKIKIDDLILENSFENNEKQLKIDLSNLRKYLKTNIFAIFTNNDVKLMHKYSTVKNEINNYKEDKRELLNKNNYYVLRKQLADDQKEIKNNIKNEHQIMVYG